MKTRISKSLSLPATRDDAEAVMNQAALTAANRRRLAATMDRELLAVKGRYDSLLAECDAAFAEAVEQLQAWAVANPGEFPKNVKSLTFAAGRLGFRTGTPKLALVNRKWTWATVLEWLASRCPEWVRVKQEVDKERILADYAARITDDAALAVVGVKVVQDESFFVEPTLTDDPA